MWLFICFSIRNIKDTILTGVVLTSVLGTDSSCGLLFCLLGLLEPTPSFVLVQCKHMTFPGLVGEPPQLLHMEPAVVRKGNKGSFGSL